MVLQEFIYYKPDLGLAADNVWLEMFSRCGEQNESREEESAIKKSNHRKVIGFN